MSCSTRSALWSVVVVGFTWPRVRLMWGPIQLAATGIKHANVDEGGLIRLCGCPSLHHLLKKGLCQLKYPMRFWSEWPVSESNCLSDAWCWKPLRKQKMIHDSYILILKRWWFVHDIKLKDSFSDVRLTKQQWVRKLILLGLLETNHVLLLCTPQAAICGQVDLDLFIYYNLFIYLSWHSSLSSIMWLIMYWSCDPSKLFGECAAPCGFLSPGFNLRFRRKHMQSH